MPTTTPTAAPRVIDVRKPAGSLIIYDGSGESLVGPIIQQFSDSTGIEVPVNYAGTPQAASTLLEEGNHFPADMFFAQNPGVLP
ncbi:MAG: hypothetical protein J4F46_07700 [Dehalococcoidia bacterium]|nr:hypothetical protein [Dehalococcoidia bacterium]